MSRTWIAQDDGSVRATCDGCGDTSPAWLVPQCNGDLGITARSGQDIISMNEWLAQRGWMVNGSDVRCPDCVSG